MIASVRGRQGCFSSPPSENGLGFSRYQQRGKWVTYQPPTKQFYYRRVRYRWVGGWRKYSYSRNKSTQWWWRWVRGEGSPPSTKKGWPYKWDDLIWTDQQLSLASSPSSIPTCKLIIFNSFTVLLEILISARFNCAHFADLIVIWVCSFQRLLLVSGSLYCI